MTDMTDIVQEAREWAMAKEPGAGLVDRLCAEVERLRAENEAQHQQIMVDQFILKRDGWREACQRISAATEAEVVLATFLLTCKPHCSRSEEGR